MNGAGLRGEGLALCNCISAQLRQWEKVWAKQVGISALDAEAVMG